MSELDITRLIIEKTEVDEETAKLSDSICTGNQKKSWFHKGTLFIDSNSAKIVFEIKLRNKQVADTVFGPVTIYEDTSTAQLIGFIGDDCLVQAYVASSENEIYKLLGAFITVLANMELLRVLIANEICSLIPRGFTVAYQPELVAELGESIIKTSDKELFDINPLACLAQFNNPEIPELDCEVFITLSEAGREYFKNETFGIITSAKCNVRVKLKKSEIPGLFSQEVVKVPQQKVKCIFNSESSPLEIDFTVSPAILFRDGVAVDAFINMDNVEGVPVFIGNFLKREVNSNQQAKQAIVDFINSLA
jgi:hypothetical protein